LTVLSVRYDKP